MGTLALNMKAGGPGIGRTWIHILALLHMRCAALENSLDFFDLQLSQF